MYFGFPSYNVILNGRSQSQWPRGLRRRSAADRLLRSWVRIPPGAWMLVCCEYCVLSGRRLCDELIIRPGESYRLWRVVVCDQETSNMRRPWPAFGRSATENKTKTKTKSNLPQVTVGSGYNLPQLSDVFWHLLNRLLNSVPNSCCRLPTAPAWRMDLCLPHTTPVMS